MFTGLVETIGTVIEYKKFKSSNTSDNWVSVTIGDVGSILVDCHIGDSIACNGICTTVTEFTEDTFKIEISPETFARTDVGKWKVNSKINLERAVGLKERFGGHYVQGHIDTVASIVSRIPQGNSILFGFSIRDKDYTKYIVEKGFISIDGVSLTINKIEKDGTFYISMIPLTQKSVAIPLKKINDEVNIETDVVGKSIEKQLQMLLESQLEDDNSQLGKMIAKIVDSKLKLSNKL